MFKMKNIKRELTFNFHDTIISSLKLSIDAKSYIEKAFWFILWITGTVFMIVILNGQIISWNENPILLRKSMVDLSTIDFPAITFCFPG